MRSAAADWPSDLDPIHGSEARGRIGKLPTVRRASDFDRAFREGKRVRGRSLLLITVRRHEGGLRVGFLTAKGVGSAVHRNRQRRRLRAACRSLWPNMTDQPADVLMMALPQAAQCGFESLREEMASLLRRAGILAPDEPG